MVAQVASKSFFSSYKLEFHDDVLSDCTKLGTFFISAFAPDGFRLSATSIQGILRLTRMQALQDAGSLNPPISCFRNAKRLRSATSP